MELSTGARPPTLHPTVMHTGRRKLPCTSVGLILLAAGLGLVCPDEAWAGKKGGHQKGDRAQATEPAAARVIRDDVEAWLLANNPGLPADFLARELPDKEVKLPDGRTVPIYQLKQFLDVNFRITFFARKQEKGSEVVPVSEEHLRKLLALPEFHERVLGHKPEYKIAGRGTIPAEEAYWYIRNRKAHLGVTANKNVKAPVGGGGGINGPSWAVWKAMNLFWHEACHCIGIGHDSGGLSGPIAGTLREWDRKKKWQYDTIDLNALALPGPAAPRDASPAVSPPSA